MTTSSARERTVPNWTDAEPATVVPILLDRVLLRPRPAGGPERARGPHSHELGRHPAEAWTSRPVLDQHARYKGEKQPGERTGKLDQNDAAVLYNGMIHPLLNYRIKGSIWYQGESNAGQAFADRELFPMMIQNW